MQINAKMSIEENNSAPTLSKGIIFHDFFLKEEIFIPLYEEYYKNNQIEINRIANELLSLIKKYNKTTVYYKMIGDDDNFQKLWEEFQKQVLLNEKPLQLLVIYRGNKYGTQSEYSQIIDQKEVEETIKSQYGYKYGINTGNQLIKDTMIINQAKNVERLLQTHVSTLLKQLYSNIDKDTAHILHQYHSDILNKIYTTSDQNKRQHITGKPWYKILYGKTDTASWQGNAYEAFFNHVANHEPEIFNYLSTHGREINAMLNFKFQRKTVYEEEGGYEFDLGNFPKLLKGQINNISWFSGGDIVIINNKLEVVYNIQLKSTIRNNPTVFEESIGKLKTFLTEFTESKIPKEKANLLFQYFQNTIANSCIVNNLEENVDQVVTDIIKQYIKNKT